MHAFAKYPVECTLTVEPCIYQDLCDGHPAVLQERTCIIQSCVIEIMIEILMKGSGKYPGKCVRAEAQVTGHTGECNVVFEVAGDIGNCLIYDVVIIRRGFVRKLIYGQASGQNQTDESRIDDRFFFRGRIFEETVDRVYNIRMQKFRRNDRCPGAGLAKKRQVQAAQGWRCPEIVGTTVSGVKDLDRKSVV